VGWKPRRHLCLLAMQGMLMLLNVSKRFKNLRIDNIFRKGWKERLLCPPKSGQALDSSSSLSSCKLLWGHTLVSVISFYWDRGHLDDINLLSAIRTNCMTKSLLITTLKC